MKYSPIAFTMVNIIRRQFPDEFLTENSAGKGRHYEE